MAKKKKRTHAQIIDEIRELHDQEDELLDELVALNSVGEKTAAAVVKHFGNSAAISMASQEDLEEIDSVSYRNALVIKERFN